MINRTRRQDECKVSKGNAEQNIRTEDQQWWQRVVQSTCDLCQEQWPPPGALQKHDCCWG